MQIKIKNGFTIVELLIVIVVIAIIAAIVIISFNGLSERARETGIKSELAQAEKQLELDKTANGHYPTTKEAAAGGTGLGQPNGQTALQYTVSSGGDSYCLSGVSGALAFNLSSSNRAPTSGVCPGHTSQAQPNLVTNYGVETDLVGWVDSRATCTRQSSAARSGSYGVACSVVDGTYMPRISVQSIPVIGGAQYTLSSWIKSSARVRIGWQPNSGGGQVLGPLVNSNNSWTNVTMTTTPMPTSATALNIWTGVEDNLPDGTLFHVDDVSVVKQ